MQNTYIILAMPVLHSIILGIVQGLTEVLPISSSAHLSLIPWFLKWDYQGLSFDVALHVGTALALLLYFFKDWVGMLRSAFSKTEERRSNMLWYIAFATIPGAVAGLILEEKSETVFRSPWAIASALAVFAVILWLADHFGRRNKDIREMNFKSAVMIGFAQAIAIIPGVSRSGITMTAALIKGFNREAAARFSFLLATPIIAAAGVLKIPKLHAADFNTAFWLGIASSMISGFIGIHFLLHFVKKASLNIFVWYRIAVSAVIILTALYR